MPLNDTAATLPLLREAIALSAGFDPARLSDEARVQDLAIDSIAITMMIARFESILATEISDEDVLHIIQAGTIGEILNVVSAYCH